MLSWTHFKKGSTLTKAVESFELDLSFQEVAAVVDHVGESVYDKYSTAEDSLGGMDSKDPLQMLDESLKSEEMEMAADNILDSLAIQGTDKYASNPYDIDLLNDDKMDICGEVSLV